MTRTKIHYTGVVAADAVPAVTGSDPYIESMTVYVIEDFTRVADIQAWCSQQRRVQIMETISGGETRYEVIITDCEGPQSYRTELKQQFELEFGHCVRKKTQE
jgi:hypothetical protein